MKFINLKQDIAYFDVIKKAFHDLIEPKYGPQNKALDKILAGVDRECEILLVNDTPKGLLVYKSELQNEFELENGFELKTLLLFDRLANKGISKYLFMRAEYHAIRLGAKHMFCTLSEKNPSLLKHLNNLGWQVLGKNESKDNTVTIHVLSKKLSTIKNKS